MANKRRSSQRSPGRFNLSSFVAGIAVGCLVSILLAATAVPVLDNYQPDTLAFPEIDSLETTYEYEFPDILEASGRREGSKQPVRELVAVGDVNESADTQVQQESIESYLLQAGSFEQQRHAEVFRATLMLRGYKASTTVVEIPGIGPRYRVVIGPYPSQVEAESAISQLKSEQVDAMLLGIRET